MSIFEVLMLVCFGLSWPISIAKALRTEKVAGKSPVFMGVICLGYLSGILPGCSALGIYPSRWRAAARG